MRVRNPATGNWVDDVSRAYVQHIEHFGELALTFEEWHKTNKCPSHPLCNFCPGD